MLDPKLVRDHIEDVRNGLDARNYPVDYVNDYQEADIAWRDSLHQLEELQAQRNAVLPKGKPSPDQLKQLSEISDKIKALKDTVHLKEDQVKAAAMLIPNLPDKSVPVGKDESENVEVRTVGKIPEFSFDPVPHDELAVRRGLIDFEQASKIAGSRFAVYKGNGARLERALINFMLDRHTQDNGYTEVHPPALVNSKSMLGTGQLPKFSDESFQIADSDLWLSPTAEVQLTNLFRDSVIDETELPVCIAGATACFRKEAGSYGKDVKGIIRNHQFNKVELVRVVSPSESMAHLDQLTADAESILQALGLPYRVVALCTGDLGFSSAKTYDIEVWFPSQKKYREISSCSNFLDFQARRAMIRYKCRGTGKVGYVHTVNGSGLAVGRTVAAILENYQEKDGSIKTPDCLVDYMGVREF